MKTIRGGRGLGDSLYLQAVVRHLVETTDQPYEVASDFPDVFAPLGRKVRVVPFYRVGLNIIAHYVARKSIAGTTQFEDMCLAAGIRKPVDLRLDWQPRDPAGVEHLLAAGKPVVCVQLPRSPMGRTDGFGEEILPNCVAIQHALEALKARATVVQIGSGRPLYAFREVIDFDLANKTSLSQLLDVASIASAFIGYPSFIVPLAECFNRRSLIVWSQRGLKSSTAFVRQITPEKLLHKKTSAYMLDTANHEEIERHVDALLQP